MLIAFIRRLLGRLNRPRVGNLAKLTKGTPGGIPEWAFARPS